MKKIRLLVLLLVVLILSMSVFLACHKDPIEDPCECQTPCTDLTCTCGCHNPVTCEECGESPCICEDPIKDNLVSLNVNFLKDFKAEIGNATSLGISRSKPVHSQGAIQSASYSVDPFKDDGVGEDKPVIVKKTIADVMEELVFTKESSKEVYDDEGNLIGSEITQEELGAQVNKLYVNHGLTFVQFIPVVSGSGMYEYETSGDETQSMYIEVRPSDEILFNNLGVDGVPEYDKKDYFSDDLHASFIIDNNSENIYKLEGVKVDEIVNGLILIGGDLYDISIEDSELKLYALLQNETVSISGYFKDSAGNNYVETDSLSIYDEETKTTFYKQSDGDYYFLSNEGVAVYLRSTVEATFPIFEEIRILGGENINLSFTSANISGSRVTSIRGREIYLTYPRGYRFAKYNIDTLELVESKTYHTAIQYNTTTSLGDDIYILFKDNKIYWANVYGEDSYDEPELGEPTGIIIQLSELSLEAERIDSLRFRLVSVQGTIYYLVVLNEEGIPELVLESEYISGDREEIIFLPL